MAEFEIKVCSGSSFTESVVGSIGDNYSAKNVDEKESSASIMGQSIQDVEDWEYAAEDTHRELQRISLPGGRQSRKENIFLRRRQISSMIQSPFKISGTLQAFWSLAHRKMTLRNSSMLIGMKPSKLNRLLTNFSLTGIIFLHSDPWISNQNASGIKFYSVPQNSRADQFFKITLLFFLHPTCR